jgi:hypothetical protein
MEVVLNSRSRWNGIASAGTVSFASALFSSEGDLLQAYVVTAAGLRCNHTTVETLSVELECFRGRHT